MRRRLFTCERTVCSEMKRRFAISSVPRCSSSRSSTSTSRALSSSAIDVRDAGVEAAALADAVEQSPRDLAGERRLAVRDAVEELGDPLRRLGLQQVAGRAGADRGEQVLLGAGRGQDDDLAVGRGGAHARQRLEPAHPGHRQVEQDEVGLELARRARSPRRRRRPRRRRGSRAARAAPTSAARVSGWSSTMSDAAAHAALIGRRLRCRQEAMRASRAQTYLAWVRDEILLVGAARGRLALLPRAARRSATPYALPEPAARSSTRPSLLVARDRLRARRTSASRSSGAASTSPAAPGSSSPRLTHARVRGRAGARRRRRRPGRGWAGIGGRLVGGGLIAAAPFAQRPGRDRAPRSLVALVGARRSLLARAAGRSAAGSAARCRCSTRATASPTC